MLTTAALIAVFFCDPFPCHWLALSHLIITANKGGRYSKPVLFEGLLHTCLTTKNKHNQQAFGLIP
jgi:hypothetical protein